MTENLLGHIGLFLSLFPFHPSLSLQVLTGSVFTPIFTFQRGAAFDILLFLLRLLHTQIYKYINIYIIYSILLKTDDKRILYISTLKYVLTLGLFFFPD